MSTYCYDKCDGFKGPPLATAILREYCGQDWEGKATSTDGPTGFPTTTGTYTDTITDKGPLPTPDEDSKRRETIIIGTVVPIGCVFLAIVLGDYLREVLYTPTTLLYTPTILLTSPTIA